MSGKYMAPWKWGRKNVTSANKGYEMHPVEAFQREMNSLFDEFFRGFGVKPFGENVASFGSFSPQINMTEDEKTIQITTELPGMDDKDIDINLSKDSITIKGEKKEETERSDKESYYMERSFGSFERVIPIPADIDPNKADASFKKGVLRITLPKLEKEKQSHKKIEIKSS